MLKKSERPGSSLPPAERRVVKKGTTLEFTSAAQAADQSYWLAAVSLSRMKHDDTDGILHHRVTDSSFTSDDERLAATVSTARISVVLDSLGISRIDVHMPAGNTTIRLRSLPGSGTQLEDCTVLQTSTAVVPGGLQLTRVVKCRPNEYHDVGGATASVVDTFTAAINGSSIKWTTNISSTSQAAWSTPIVACLGWASWADSSRAWLGGPREMRSVSLKYDPLAPFALEKTTAAPFSRLYYGGELPTQSIYFLQLSCRYLLLDLTLYLYIVFFCCLVVAEGADNNIGDPVKKWQ